MEMNKITYIPNMENYLITEDGRIFSFKRGKLKERAIQTDIGGYSKVKLSKNYKDRKNFRVSYLVAISYLPNPHNHPIVLHIDDNPKNNHYTNLKWGTQSDNIKDRQQKNRQAIGNKHGRIKLTKNKCKKILKLRGKITNRQIAKKFKVGIKTIYNVYRGKSYNSKLV